MDFGLRRRVRDELRDRMLGVVGVERASMYDVRRGMMVRGEMARSASAKGSGNLGVRGARVRCGWDWWERRAVGVCRL